MAGSDFRPVPVEDIRASKITFEDFIIRCFDRMDFILPDCVKNNNYQIIDSKVRFIHAITRFYTKQDATYNAEIEKVKKKLKDIGSWNYDYYLVLMEWIEALTAKFQLMGIIGPIKVSWGPKGVMEYDT